MNFIDPTLDAYCERNSGEETWSLKERVAETHDKVQMPVMLSGHLQGRFLAMLSKLLRPRIAVEIGTCTGYGARWRAGGAAVLMGHDVRPKITCCQPSRSLRRRQMNASMM